MSVGVRQSGSYRAVKLSLSLTKYLAMKARPVLNHYTMHIYWKLEV
jgi:hypothetical protein